MHKIDLESSPEQAVPQPAEKTQEKPVPQPVVDDSAPVQDNQTSTVTPMTKKQRSVTGIIFAVVAILAGVGTGYGTHQLFAGSTGNGSTDVIPVSEGSIKAGDVFGSQDTETFKDHAEGYLEAGGFEGEGSHKLLRPGGEAQTVYLTSSVTDLDALVGMEVEVWGETFKGQKAGWLMDVGRVKVQKVEGEAPVVD